MKEEGGSGLSGSLSSEKQSVKSLSEEETVMESLSEKESSGENVVWSEVEARKFVKQLQPYAVYIYTL